MSEKRYTWKTEKLQHLDDEVIMVVDNENKDWKGHILNIVDKLNEQQVIINDQEQKIGILQQEIVDTQAILEMLSEKLKGWS